MKLTFEHDDFRRLPVIDLVVSWTEPLGPGFPGGTLVQLFGVSHQDVPARPSEVQPDAPETVDTSLTLSPVIMVEEINKRLNERYLGV